MLIWVASADTPEKGGGRYCAGMYLVRSQVRASNFIVLVRVTFVDPPASSPSFPDCRGFYRLSTFVAFKSTMFALGSFATLLAQHADVNLAALSANFNRDLIAYV